MPSAIGAVAVGSVVAVDSSAVEAGSAAVGVSVDVASTIGMVSVAAGVSVSVGAGAALAPLSFFSFFGVKCFLKKSLIPASWNNVSNEQQREHRGQCLS